MRDAQGALVETVDRKSQRLLHRLLCGNASQEIARTTALFALRGDVWQLRYTNSGLHRGSNGARARAIPHRLRACRQGPCAVRKRRAPFEPARPNARAMAEAVTRRSIRPASDPVQQTSECARERHGAR